jgi:hypothetical protein
MPEKKRKARKPKDYAKLSQKQKFIAAAKAADGDESGETFREVFSRIAPPKREKGGKMEIAIYAYKRWDQINGTYGIPERRATEAFIQKARGEIIDGSEAIVDETCVDDEGQEILKKTTK